MNSRHDIEVYESALEKSATIDDAIQYAHDVVSGKIISGKHLRWACNRFISDLDRDDERCKFSRGKAQRALNFFPLFCCHIKGDLEGQPIVLESWQAFIIIQLFGFHKKNRSGKWVRRFKWAYIEVARKNGKSTLISGIALYMLAFDGEGGAEVWCAAVDKDQAKIVWDAAVAMVELSPALNELLKITKSKNLLELPNNYSKFQPLSRDTKKMDGLNVHCGILDELHAHPDRQVFDLVKDGMSSRLQALLAMITTAGVNKLGICYEQRQYVESILDPDIEEENDDYLGVIFSLDDSDDPYDPSCWAKANPCLGISKPYESIESAAKLAKVSGSARINFMIKDLNRWVDGGIRWLDSQAWLGCSFDIPAHALDLPCWVGVDLSISGDLTAIVLIFKSPEKWYVKTEFYYPEESLKDSDLDPSVRKSLKEWSDNGHLMVMPGHMIDLDKIELRIKELYQLYNVSEVCVDPWKAQQLNYRLAKAGVDVMDVGQTVKNLSETMYTIEGYILEDNVVHDGNPVMSWMMSNVEVSLDKNDNIFPYKANNNRSNKIDGASAFFTGAFRALIDGGIEEQKVSIYETEGVGC